MTTCKIVKSENEGDWHILGAEKDSPLVNWRHLALPQRLSFLDEFISKTSSWSNPTTWGDISREMRGGLWINCEHSTPSRRRGTTPSGLLYLWGDQKMEKNLSLSSLKRRRSVLRNGGGGPLPSTRIGRREKTRFALHNWMIAQAIATFLRKPLRSWLS